MFHKAFRVKSNSAIKGSDRKRWKSLLETTYPSLSSEDIKTFLPSKGDVTISKVLTHGGTSLNVVIHERNPVFFEVDNAVYPTVYTLWRYPEMLPVFTTWTPVFAKLNNGADLMLPGVVLGGRDSGFGPKSFGRIGKGDPCAVNLSDNRAPVAVGRAALSSEDMYLSGKRGKGVIVLHTYNDQLWAIGDKRTPPDLGPPFPEDTKEISTEEVSDVRNDDIAAYTTISDVSLATGALKIEAENGQSTTLSGPFASMDELIYYCLLKALKTTAKKVEYPLLASTFYRSHLLPCVPKGHTLDVKKTSFKKLSKFLLDVQQKGLLESKELTKGVESVVSINLLHPEVRKFVVDENDVDDVEAASVADSTAKGRQSGCKYEPPIIEELYLVSAAVLPLFKLYGCGKSSPLSASDVRQIITKYVKDNDLQQQSAVVMDPILTDVLLSKQEWSTTSCLKWDEIQARCLKKMNPGYRITFFGREPIIRRGTVEPIEISVAQRAANKKVTLLNNLEVFGIDPAELAHTVQVGVAASTSVSPAANRKDGLQVLIQGNQVTFLTKLLLDEYKLPRKYVKGLELAKGRKSLPKQKKI